MNKKLAVFANGWNREAMLAAMTGIRKYAKKEDFDIFVFLCHAAYSEHAGINEGELNIYGLGDMKDYDGAIVFSTMLNSNETVELICRRAKENRVPAVSIGMEIEGASYIGMDNAAGMRQLVTHLVEEHGAKRVAFIAGNIDHTDSIARLQVTREVLREHGLELKESDIYYADWGYGQSIEAVHRMIESEEGLPDAIVCANDTMALAAGSELVNQGYRVPEDIAITGFDHVNDGKNFYPSLTSVDLNFEQIGYECCRMIYEMSDGVRKGEPYDRKTLPRKIVPTGMALAESCGCLGNRYYEEWHKNYCGHSYINSLKADLLDQSERILQMYFVSSSQDYDSLKRNLQHFYGNNHTFEGEDFAIVLNKHYFKDVMMEESELAKDNMAENLETVVSLRDGAHQEFPPIKREELVPGYEKKEGEQHAYYFLPLHSDRNNFGYVVFRDEPFVIASNVTYSYLERLQQALKNLRTNLRLDTVNRKLTQIYDKDPMTGLFNRFGYENKALPLFEHCRQNHSVMMVMFVDINYMKRINDVYGHIHGDNAIRIVADSIKENLEENWIAVRFGGDEFLIIAPDCDHFKADDVRQNILDYLDRKNRDGMRRYRISASCGYVLTDPEKDLGLQDYIKEADDVMYEIKRQVHARDNK